MNQSVDDYETDKVCIVGAGPSGLIMARQLAKASVPFDVFEKHSYVGGIWDPDNIGSPIYSSAHFISSKHTSYFYGFPMPAIYPDYPSQQQLLDYIRAFAEAYGLYDRITFDCPVESARPDDGGWVVTAGGQERHYRALIAAPGVNWHPNLPDYPGISSYTGDARHSVTYNHPDEFRQSRVLIVGGGNSGADIACDAARSADATFFSVRRGYRYLPKYVFGIPTDVYVNEGGQPPAGVVMPEDPSALLDALVGDLTRFGLPAPDHDALASHPILNTQILHHLAHGEIIAKPDVARFTSSGAIFTDGTEEPVDTVIFATGYDSKIPFVDESLFEWNGGRPQLYLNIFHRAIDNLYVLGFVEFADAAYHRFDEMAQLIAIDLTATGADKARFTDLKSTHQPDLRGGMDYIDSARHANYVETHTYQHVMSEVRDSFGWPAVDDSSFPTRSNSRSDRR